MSGLYPPTTSPSIFFSNLKRTSLKVVLVLLLGAAAGQLSFAQQNRKADHSPNKPDNYLEKSGNSPEQKKITVQGENIPPEKIAAYELEQQQRQSTPGNRPARPLNQKTNSVITNQNQATIDKNKNLPNETPESKAKLLLQQQEEARYAALPGVQYTIFTNSQGQVGYRLTNNNQEVLSQTISVVSFHAFRNKFEAEKEAIVAASAYRRNSNLSQQELKNAIRNLVNGQSYAGTVSRDQSTMNTLADITFNGGSGTIPASGTSGIASPYPSTINVSGVPINSPVKSVTINGFGHTFPADVDIVLQSPTGTNVILMSDAGGGTDVTGVNITFEDAAGGDVPSPISSGTYKPTNIGTPDNFVAPGPGSLSQSAPALSSFGLGNHNGTWSLFVVDDAGLDIGSWTSWSITFSEPAAVCFPITIIDQPGDTTGCTSGVATFTVNAGPNGISYNWQEDQGSGFAYLSNGGVYSGVNSATLTITNPTPAMNGYQYRCVITCSGGGLPEISDPATLTVASSPPGPVIIPTEATICPGGSVALNFVPDAVIFSGGGITIPAGAPATTGGPADPYPSNISVSGVPLGSTVKSVIINGFNHTFPGDVDIVLQSPTGTNVILLSDRGGGTDVVNVNLTLDDAAAALVPTTIVSGTYRPTNTAGPDAWPAPGPASFTQVNPTLSTFAGDFNGTWKLFINDQFLGDVGSITSWAIIFNTPPGGPTTASFSPITGLFTDPGLTTAYDGSPVSIVYASPASTTVYSATIDDGTCVSTPTLVTVTVNTPPAITVQPPAAISACAGGSASVSVTATGSGLTYQWQLSTGGAFSNITAGSAGNPGGTFYTGFNTNTLSINNVLSTMTGYRYRCMVSGSCTPSQTSNETILTVNSLPLISVAASGQCAPFTLTASGADTYTWAPAAGLSATTGATVTANPAANTIYTVTGTIAATGCQNTSSADVKYTPTAPGVTPSSATICVGTIQQFSSGSVSSAVASSGAISVPIPDDEFVNGANHALNVAGVPGGATITGVSVTFNITHTWDSDLDINLVAPNGNILNLVFARGGSGDNFINTTISSASTTSLGTGSPPFTGTFGADGDLFNILGAGPSIYLSNVTDWPSLYSVPNGTWRLAVADFVGGDVGTINSWSITVNYSVGGPAVWTPNGPGSGLFTDAAGTVVYNGTPVSTVYASPASTTTYSVTQTNTSTQTRTFSTGGTVVIPTGAPVSTSGAGNPYPSTLIVSGIPANATVKSVKLKGVKHTFPDDLDILLESPSGDSVVLMSDVGGSADATGFHL